MDSRLLIFRLPDEDWTPLCLNPGVAFVLVWWSGAASTMKVWVLWQLLTVILRHTIILKSLFGLLLHVISQMTIMCFKMIHRTCVMKEYMEETDIHGMEWPSQSPDLNVIENVWHKIKHELQKHVQNITSSQLVENCYSQHMDWHTTSFWSYDVCMQISSISVIKTTERKAAMWLVNL